MDSLPKRILAVESMQVAQPHGLGGRCSNPRAYETRTKQEEASCYLERVAGLCVFKKKWGKGVYRNG